MSSLDALRNSNMSTKVTPQSQPIPGSGQVANAAGGYVFKVGDFERLTRFLILGTEGGTFYIGQNKLTKDNAEVVARCLKSDPKATINHIVDVSKAGRAANNDYAIYALAMACSPAFNSDISARKLALDSIPEVCRIGTHLFHFAEFVEQFRGWGRGLRNAVGNWYDEKDAQQLAYQLIKYRQRDGWSHRDLLRLSHPTAHGDLYDFVAKGDDPDRGHAALKNEKIAGFVMAQESESAKRTAELVTEFGLPHEALKTDHKNDPEVVMALLEKGMPIGALIRNLATYTRSGVLDVGSRGEKIVLDALANEEAIHESRIHPIKVLSALMAYSSGDKYGTSYGYGYGGRGKGLGDAVANPRIIDALDDAFYLAFDNVQPTGKTRMLALDVSGSMGWPDLQGIPGLTPAIATGALAMVAARSGDPYQIGAFTTNFRTLNISAKQRLDDVLNTIRGLPFGGTDCSLPMVWAQKNKKYFDSFEVYTDSETWLGGIHPAQALAQYRKAFNPNAKLIVHAMVASHGSIADPNDPGMLDVVGFDASAPEIITEFIKGNV